MPTAFKIALADALRAVPTPDGKRFAERFAHGTLVVEIYAPSGSDQQKPHNRDELYIVTHGTGEFVYQGDRVPFVPGDLLFAAAGVPHRFEHFSDDFSTWVIFYGPQGGEK